MSEPSAAPVSGSTGVPGLRTMRSASFRTTVALLLLLIGGSLVGLLLIRQATAEGGQFAIDFGAYYLAAERSAAGEAIYAAVMLQGPVDAQGVDQYLYPPLFAQLLRPLTVLSLEGAALVWFLTQSLAVFAALWVGTGIGGARRSVERALWCAVAAVFFLPVFDTLWKGNVSGVLALSSIMVALGGTAAGFGAGFGALLKAVPGTLVPAALVMDSRSRLTVVVTLGAALGLSFLLAPAAWLDYPAVVRNMLAGSSDYATNLAPAAVVGRSVSDVAGTAVRVGTLGLAVVSVLGSVWMARSHHGGPAAALLGVIALLLVPASLWYHYLAILLPFAAMAWPRANGLQRGLLFGAAVLVTVGLAWLPAAFAGGTVMGAVSLFVLWPRSRQGKWSALPRPDHGTI
ncbi:MAG: glycosyltransferase family 87 protein [Chloroflexota bacterium]